MTKVVTQRFRDRWRSGKYIGAYKPGQTVRVRRGVLDRGYRPFEKLDGTDDYFGYISGTGRHQEEPWQAFWRTTGDWINVPNVSEVSLDGAFDNNGITTATITVENTVLKEIGGVAGIFHAVRRGYLSPWQGWATFGRVWPAGSQAQNEWFEVFNGGYQVQVLQGYGDELTATFNGLIDEARIAVSPDQITVVARDFGQALTDLRVFGHNKAPELASPIVFSDRLKADDVTAVGGSAAASTSDAGNPPKYVTKKGTETYWLSHGHTTPDNTEWVQVRIPKGRYETIFIDPHYEGMEVYLGMYLRRKGMGTKDKPEKCKVDGVEKDDGWLNMGFGDVPGVHGGWPFVKKWRAMANGGNSYKLPFKLECGDDTVVRIGFRKLGFSPTKRDYRAGASRVAMMQRKRKPEAKREKWILVDDASDIVKWALMWAGFKEWNVEKFGVKIKDKMVFHQGEFLIDIIRRMGEQGDFTFHVAPPSAHPESIGVPTFIRSRAVSAPQPRMEEVRDSDLLTEVDSNFSKESLAYIIRVRGMMSQKAGKPLGEDSTKRVMAVYLPPWSGAHHNVATGAYDASYPFADRLAGMRKHVIYPDEGLETEDECMMACILIALQEALAAFTANIQIPGHPGIDLADQISMIDQASGLNTRLWIASRSSRFTVDEQGSAEWSMSLGGSLIDTPDILALAFDYLTLLAKVQANAAT